MKVLDRLEEWLISALMASATIIIFLSVLHRALASRYGWRGVVSFGPGEEDLAQAVVAASGSPQPLKLALDLGPLMALMRRTKFVVSADTGPLHLASALGAPVVGLFGPTDPSRNGPYSPDDVVVRNLQASETTDRKSVV